MKRLLKPSYFFRVHSHWFLHTNTIRIVGAFVSILVLVTVYAQTVKYYEDKADNYFIQQTMNHFNHIENSLQRYENVLQSGVGFFQGSDIVSREEWHKFVEALNLEMNYPGVQGVGYAQMFTSKELENIEKALAKEGFKRSVATSAPPTDLHSSILYLEPLDKRNLEAIGYDMYSESVRREAMNLAARTGKMAISGKVTLVQEIDEDVQAGFLMYLPYYGKRNGDSAYNEANVKGFIYSPFRMNDFIRTVRSLQTNDFRLSIYDTNEGVEESKLYQSAPSQNNAPIYKHTYALELGGRVWHVVYESSLEFEKSHSSYIPLILGGIGALFYLFFMSIILELLRKRALLKVKMNELEQSNQWLDILLTNSADGLHILDEKGNLIEWSPSFCRMLGYRESEIKHLNVFEWEANFTSEKIEELMQNLSEVPISLESQFRCYDGTLIDVEIKAHAFMDGDKKLIFASSWDITSRKKSEKLLTLEKNNAQSYLDIVEVMILVLDTDYTIKLINRKGCELIGYSADEAIGQNFVDLFIPPRLRNGITHVADELATNSGYRYHENYIVTKNGTERLVAWHNKPMLNEDGEIVGILSSGEDVTEIRFTQERLQESEMFYKTIFSSVDEAILILYDDVIIDSNELAITLFGGDDIKIIGSDFYDLFVDIQCPHDSIEEYFQRAYNGVLATAECSVWLQKEPEESKTIDFTLSKFGKTSERKLIMVVRDISQKVEEERLLTMHARQAQMGEMISMIAHQWRQPLAIINAITSQMRLRALLADSEDEALIENLIKIEEQSSHLSQTISDYRDFFRPDKPKERFYIMTLIQNALNLIDHALKNHSIHIEIVALQNPQLMTYRNELLQVLIVLLKNALDAFIEKNFLDGKIEILIDVRDAKCFISITDNAGGISPEIMKKLFIPYFTTKKNGLGTGLGLHMSRIIIQEHCEGKIAVTSSGRESVFTITLPYEEEE